MKALVLEVILKSAVDNFLSLDREDETEKILLVFSAS